jgi:hypothetical protein
MNLTDAIKKVETGFLSHKAISVTQKEDSSRHPP